MKTKLLSVFLILSGITNAQTWFQQTSGTDSTLWDVYFVNQDTGFVCGVSGTILKTTNGGTNWTSLTTGFTDSIQVIRFLNADTGFACGMKNGKLFKTTNGGNTWNNIGPNMSGKYNGGIWFTSSDTGFLAVGDSPWSVGNRKILKTHNSGTTWDTVYSGTNWINYFYFVNSNIGYVTATNGNVLKTTNAGNSWSALNNFGNYWMSANYFLNKDTGFVGGGNCIVYPDTASGKIWKTTDGGLNWQTVLSDTSGTGNKIFLTGANNGYTLSHGDCTGASDSILKTTNGGTTWTNELTVKNNFRGFFFISSEGYAVGDSGVIIKYGIMTATNNFNKHNYFSILPNPFSTQTTLHSDILLKNANLTVYNSQGQQVKQLKNISGQSITLHRDNLPDGLYFIRLTEGNKIIASEKLIIE